MNAALQFTLLARNGQEPKVTTDAPRITYEGQSTFFKFCTSCADLMPHVRRDDYSECVVCGNRTYAKPKPESENKN